MDVRRLMAIPENDPIVVAPTPTPFAGCIGRSGLRGNSAPPLSKMRSWMKSGPSGRMSCPPPRTPATVDSSRSVGSTSAQSIGPQNIRHCGLLKALPRPQEPTEPALSSHPARLLRLPVGPQAGSAKEFVRSPRPRCPEDDARKALQAIFARKAFSVSVYTPLRPVTSTHLVEAASTP